MAHWKCIGCGFRAGTPRAHHCGNSGLWEHCTCGSGGHPRRCDLHPSRYDAHIAELNAENGDEEVTAS